MGYRPLSDATLMGMTKKVIIEMLRIAEHNFFAAEETLAQQAENLRDWAPVVHGKWIEHDDFLGRTVECSECHSETMGDTPYCPACGAKMDGKGEDDGQKD